MELLPAGDPGTVAAKLVLDGVLEIEASNGYVSGPAAHAEIVERSAETGSDGLAELSLVGLRYGALLDLEPIGVANRLYMFNRAPLTARLRRRLPTDAAVSRALRVSRGGRTRRLLDERGWEDVEPVPRLAMWRMFRRRGRSSGRLRFKLYVSPSVDALVDGGDLVLGALADSDAGAFKIGRELPDLVRADKLVAYFATRRQLAAAASAVIDTLSGAEEHGVPFTAGIGARGIASWGSDPPRAFQRSPWERPSWRQWVVDRLAVSLASARAAEPGTDPVAFALDRLALEGVDVSTWAPDPTIWNRASDGR